MAPDIVVVGSGFGGSFAATRLAERGLRVLWLERGGFFGPGGEGRADDERRPFPRGLAALGRSMRAIRVARRRRAFERVIDPRGLFEVHSFDHLDVLTASGVGGGSLVYTNVLERPDRDFYDALPEEITESELAPSFARAEEWLRPAAIPAAARAEPRFQRFEAAANALGWKVETPALAVVHDDGVGPRPNAAGVTQRPCTRCGGCVLGCDVGAKTSLDLAVVPRALQSGAELRILAEVLRIGRQGRGYVVDYLDRRNGQTLRVETPRLVLAAGTMVTLRLLFDAIARGDLASMPALGKHFSPNADALALIRLGRGIDRAHRGSSFEAFVRKRDVHGNHHHLVAELALPFAALDVTPLGRIVAMLTMGRDLGNATVDFEDGFLRTDAGRDHAAAVLDAIAKDVASFAVAYGGRPMTKLPFGPRGRRLGTVHPLGGVSIGDRTRGVVGHDLAVHGHPGLYVADGSVYPEPPGVPPSLTIAALADRMASLVA